MSLTSDTRGQTKRPSQRLIIQSSREETMFPDMNSDIRREKESGSLKHLCCDYSKPPPPCIPPILHLKVQIAFHIRAGGTQLVFLGLFQLQNFKTKASKLVLLVVLS